ncbi:MAG: hypothetical protein Q9160_006276 [Pyrenula sp. 1 TL-2023]
MLQPRFYSGEPPDLQTRVDMKPTLLVSWWCTAFALTTIAIRLGGRFVRTEVLFREDKIMALSIIPLLARMGFVHVILLYGTNNTKSNGLTAEGIHEREIGSRLVLASRILYAAFIWTAKFTVSEFLKRLIGAYWRKSYEIGLQIIRYFLLATFLAVIIATLGECHPVQHYWQVIPDPGPKCRQGFAQLLTMGVCDVITDILLVAYPIPIVWMSAMTLKRKIQLSLLFMLSLALVAITCYRIPMVINRQGSQQYRSLLASLEILAATGVSNAIVIGSFIRDRGVKKQKFKFGSVGGSSLERTPTRQQAIYQNHWGSDADLVGDLGITLQPELHPQKAALPRPAPAAAPAVSARHFSPSDAPIDPNWSFRRSTVSELDKASLSSTSTDPKAGLAEPVSPTAPHLPAPRKMSFFDVGGLLESSSPPDSARSRRSSQSTNIPMQSLDLTSNQSSRTPHSTARAFLSDVGGLLSSHREEDPPNTINPSNTNTGPSRRTSLNATPFRNFRGGAYLSMASTQYSADETQHSDPSSAPGGENTRRLSGLAGRRGRSRENELRRSIPRVNTQVGGNVMELQDAGGLLGLNR